MISEIFLTPQVFSTNENGGEQRLRDLKEVLFPRSGASPVVVTNLEKCEWVKETTKMISVNSNHKVKALAISLFEKVQADILVERSMPSNVMPKTETEWLERADRTHFEYPLTLAVNSEHLKETKLSELIVLDDCSSELLSNCMINPRRIERTTIAQDQLLKSLCGHAHWMIIQFPFLRGIDDEYVTLRQIFRLVDKRAIWMNPCEIEVQISPSHSKAVATIRLQLDEERFKRSTNLVRLASHEFSDRTILAGTFATRLGEQIKVARWLVQPNHPAVQTKRELRSDVETTWSFFGRKEASAMLEKLQTKSPVIVDQ